MIVNHDAAVWRSVWNDTRDVGSVPFAMPARSRARSKAVRMEPLSRKTRPTRVAGSGARAVRAAIASVISGTVLGRPFFV